MSSIHTRVAVVRIPVREETTWKEAGKEEKTGRQLTKELLVASINKHPGAWSFTSYPYTIEPLKTLVGKESKQFKTGSQETVTEPYLRNG
jgi:hypothetical protein